LNTSRHESHDERGAAVTDDDAPASSLADRLGRLFATVHPPNRGPYTDREVADAINEKYGEKRIDRSYVWMLRTGQRDNPTKKHLEALAEFFSVPASYFFDDAAAARIDAELELIAAFRDNGVRRVALRVAGLDDDAREAVVAMIDVIQKMRGHGDDSP
jgi:transcriptional regulator with XRE-family HTH domain